MKGKYPFSNFDIYFSKNLLYILTYYLLSKEVDYKLYNSKTD